MNEVYIVDYLRTPFSYSDPTRPERDAFGEIRADHLLGYVLRNLFEHRLKNKINAKDVDELLVGTSLQVSENFLYGGRNPGFCGNMPASVPTVGIDRQCGSAMTAIHYGTMSIMTGYADIIVSSGMEHLSRVSMHANPHIDIPTDLAEPGSAWYLENIDLKTGYSMVQTAQRLFEEESDKISKEDMDKLALRSHQKATKALDEGYFKGEILPITIQRSSKLAEEEIIDEDLSIRRRTTLKIISMLRPVSQPHAHKGAMSKEEYKAKFGTDVGMITAGNSSPLNAGAAACVLMSEDEMKKRKIAPLAKIISMGWAGVDPSVMGRGTVSASKKALKRAGLKAKDIDYWEINEAFSIVTLNCMKKFNIPEEIVNIKGGAISIGHPLGASGARLPGTLARILKEKNARYGLATLCVGGGQGVSLIIENTLMS